MAWKKRPIIDVTIDTDLVSADVNLQCAGASNWVNHFAVAH